MEHIPPDDVLQIGLGILRGIGERMHYKSKTLNCFRAFNIVLLLVNLFFVSANYPQIGADHAKYIKTTECTFTICHVLFKYSLFIYHKPNIESLLDEFAKFFDYKCFGNRLFLETKAMYRNVKFIQIYYLVLAVACITTIYLKPLINTNNRFLLLCWTFSGSIELETIILACQYYFWLILFAIVAGYDGLYFCYSVHIVVQVRLLKQKLKNMALNVKVQEIAICIKHHKLLLSIFVLMGKIYFWMLLLHYFITLVTGCSLLYVMLIGATDKGDLFASIIYLSGLLFQFAYFSFPVEAIVFELTDISRAIYMSNWYEQDVKTRKILLFIMTKAQRQKYLSGGGIIDINVDAFGSVCRKAFSFYALLKNVVSR